MYKEPFFCSIFKSSFAWPKYDEPKGSNVLIILHCTNITLHLLNTTALLLDQMSFI